MNTSQLRNRKDRFPLVFLFFVIFCVVVLSLAMVCLVINSGNPHLDNQYGLVIVAEELLEKPQNYYSWKNPDAYVLQAISNLGEMVVVGSWNESEISQIAAEYGTTTSVSIEFNNKYYNIALGSMEPTSPTNTGITSWVLAGWVIFVALSVCILVVNRVYRKK